ncbi:peptidase [Streptomyces venezuelae]|uniref:Peptidase n=1 Tax=Streptomyces venezuelae TaxID=54571 RepID=A0A5P2C3T0_STRVZ|nr:serine hydrolase domain-containing protein [Streptomyces venezuelae]QES37455.1 peptidase [Streptomyces venezuelae]
MTDISRRTGLTAAAAALLAGTAGVPASAAAPRTPNGPRGRALQRGVDAIRATGASGVLAEVQDARGRTTARAGVSDLDAPAKGPVPWGAYYRIGSDTKTYTATVVLQLVQEGRLKLTDTVERWLPGAIRAHGNDGRRITVTNLLRQTSGLNEYITAESGDFTPDAYRRNRFRPQSPQEQLAVALAKPPQWLPDADDPAEERRWGYSNTNYVVAGMLVEAVTGHPWAQEVHERIIEPLGLRHTLIPGTSSYVPRPTATGYTYFPEETRPTETTLGFGGGADGCLISTTHDHGIFLRALLGGRLLRPAQLAAMKSTVPVSDWIPADGVRYGLGIASRPLAGREDGLWFHGGTSLGYVSEGGVTPDGTTAVTAAAFTLRLDSEETHLRQARAALRMVEEVLGAKR